MYILEGNIGVGKSTFLDLLTQNCPEISIIQEPLDSWNNNTHGKSLLENFYNNPNRWAYTIETMAMITRANDHIEQQSNANHKRIMERSIYSGHYCFALNGKSSGYFNDIEWEIYLKWVDFLLHKNCQPPHGFIYLQASPTTCIARVKKRNRVSEKDLTLFYLRQIHDRHEAFLGEKQNVHECLKDVPVLVLNCDQEFEQDKEVMRNHGLRVRNFLEKTQMQQRISKAKHSSPNVQI